MTVQLRCNDDLRLASPINSILAGKIDAPCYRLTHSYHRYSCAIQLYTS